MASFIKEYALDPTVLFIGSVLIVPLTKTQSNAERIAYLLDPYLLGSLALMIYMVWSVRGLPALSARDRKVARWYVGKRCLFVKFALLRLTLRRL